LKNNLEVSIHPISPERWQDFEKLFGQRGACGGCWCMWWRLTRKVFELQKGEKNKATMRKIVDSGQIPGLIAYRGNNPVGWIAVAPRKEFPALKRSRILKPIDNQSVWSIVCFFVDKKFRNQGLTKILLKGAITYVSKQGGNILEGYPVEPKKDRTADVFVYTGIASAFKGVGFQEMVRRSETRPIMRYYVSEKKH
jgi:hypothetical protein